MRVSVREAERLFHLSVLQSWKLIELNLLLLVVMSDSATSTLSVRFHPRAGCSAPPLAASEYLKDMVV